SVTPETRAYSFGFHQMMDNLGAVFGPLLAFSLARFAHWDLRWIFGFAIVPGLCAVAVLVFGVKEPDVANKPKDKGGRAPVAGSAEGGTARSRIDASVKRYLLAVGVFSLGASADSFMLLRMQRQGLGVVWLPIAWLSLNAVKALTNVGGGRLSDRFGHKWTLLGGWTLYAIVYAILPIAHTWTATWLVMLGYGFYYGLAEGAEKALLTELAPKEERGRAFGMLHAITGAAVLPANAIFGFVFDTRPELAFGIGAAFAALGAALLSTVPPCERPRAA
ncbi:MAG TPA: MFS transporter, partial [Polyangiaceae bacterium]